MREQSQATEMWDRIVARDPLVLFSWYLSGRVSCVVSLGSEITKHLDDAYSGESGATINMEPFHRAEMLMWFWVLGAYEVVRTMCQAAKSFRPEVLQPLQGLKKELSKARMPAAKMEPPGSKQPVPSSRSPAAWEVSAKDMLVGDPTKDMISARSLIAQFGEVISSITADDILCSHEESYE